MFYFYNTLHWRDTSYMQYLCFLFVSSCLFQVQGVKVIREIDALKLNSLVNRFRLFFSITMYQESSKNLHDAALSKKINS